MINYFALVLYAGTDNDTGIDEYWIATYDICKDERLRFLEMFQS